MHSVLFVCSANQFRSPLAEAAFKQCLEEDRDLEEWNVSSAGLWAIDGSPAIHSVMEAASKLGLTLEPHRSQLITAKIMKDSDLVIVMQAGQREALQIEFPTMAHKVRLLSEVADGVMYDIPDPFETDQGHEELAQEICNMVRRGYDNICLLAQKKDGKP